MTVDLTIPRSQTTPLNISLGPGEVLFVLGANGTGKSSLMHHFYRSNLNIARRISAHRQNWFNSSAVDLSAAQRKQNEAGMKGADQQPKARWSDDYHQRRTSIAIFDLVDSENTRARKIANALDVGNKIEALSLSSKDSTIRSINNLLKISNLDISISIEINSEIVAHRSDGRSYSAAELSDGERNLLLISAETLTASPGTLIIIDEPERHLHRSIISPLLTNLLQKRPDCTFIISTHEIMLPLDNPGVATLLLRGCEYNGSQVANWSAELMISDMVLEEDIKRDILGTRKDVIFIEGKEGSLDKALYSIIFPGFAVIPKSSCRDVLHTVSAIRSVEGLHWLRAFGIVDHDGRPPNEIDDLKTNGVYALSVFSVESIYYHPDIMRKIAERHAAVTGADAQASLASANTAALGAVVEHKQRLIELAALRRVREEIFKSLPTQNLIKSGTPICINVDTAGVVKKESETIEDAIGKGDLLFIVCRYPVRDTPALTEIVRRIGFQKREQYEGAVRKLLLEDADARTFIRSLFGTLATDIGVT